MKMNFVSLNDIIEKPISGEWGDGEGDIKILRTTNFTNDGKLNLKEVVKRTDKVETDSCHFEKRGSIVFAIINNSFRYAHILQ